MANEIVGFYLTGTSTTSYVDIGQASAPTAALKDGDASNLVTINMPRQNMFWLQDEVQAVQIGTSTTKTKTKHTSAYNYENWKFPAIFDTGTTMIYAPAGLGHELLLRLARGNKYLFDKASGMMVVDCTTKAKFEDIYLTIQGNQYSILVEDYWFEVQPENYWEDPSCFIGIIQERTINYWLLGDVFLRGYYTVWDNNDATAASMKFAPHATSSKPKVIENIAIPVANVEDVLWELTWFYDAYFFNITGALESTLKSFANLWIFWFGLV